MNIVALHRADVQMHSWKKEKDGKPVRCEGQVTEKKIGPFTHTFISFCCDLSRFPLVDKLRELYFW